jgi:hypothetical protein
MPETRREDCESAGHITGSITQNKRQSVETTVMNSFRHGMAFRAASLQGILRSRHGFGEGAVLLRTGPAAAA